MIRRTVFLVLMFLLIFPCSVQSEPAWEVFEPLTQAEMAVPAGRYQAGVDMHHNCRVDMDAPLEEPVLSWSVRPDSNSSRDVMVDSEGGTWYAENGSGEFGMNKIIRLNPDGSVDWEREFIPVNPIEKIVEQYIDDTFTPYWISYIYPSIAVADAIIIHIHHKYNASINLPDEDNLRWITISFTYLVCLDLDGNTRWRSENVEDYDPLVNQCAWRVDNDRLALIASDNTFNVYSLETGEFLETVEVPGWSANSNTGPIVIADGSWIIHGNVMLDDFMGGYPYIYRINPDGTYQWKAEYQTDTFSMNITVDEDGNLLYGNRQGIRVIDSSDGTEIWRQWGGLFYACGVTPSGDYVAIGEFGGDDRRLGLLDSEGEGVWSVMTEWPLLGHDDVIIYRDGCILYGDRSGISLVEPDGEIRWSIEPDELGCPEADRLGHWQLNPTPDGGIVALSMAPYEEESGRVIYNLVQAD